MSNSSITTMSYIKPLLIFRFTTSFGEVTVTGEDIVDAYQLDPNKDIITVLHRSKSMIITQDKKFWQNVHKPSYIRMMDKYAR